MQQKLRRKFILVSMASLMTVLILLVAGINLLHYNLQLRAQEQLLDLIIGNGGSVPIPPPKQPPGAFSAARPISPEAGFTTRYFIVRSDARGAIKAVEMDFIASISEEEAKEYVGQILARGKISGFYGEYRFRVYPEGEETVFVFLNSSKELESMKLLAAASALLALLISAAVWILLSLSSKAAIRPFINNLEGQKRFITDAGHELKTPLTSIAASADVLALTQGENEWVKNIQKQSRRLAKLVGELVALSRLDEANPLREIAEFSLSEAIWEAAEPFLALARAAGKDFETDIEEGLLYRGSQSEIQTMLSALLDNALRYSDEGGSIRLSARRARRSILIEVWNSCEAIETRRLSRLFERFHREEASRARHSGGTGIGLSIAKAIAQAHKGSISAHSEDGRSIRIRVAL